jgi:Fe-Mn family superoxide dismutase
MNTQLKHSGRARPVATDHQVVTAPVFAMPPLPYAEAALEPVISAATVRLHHHKHQQGYVDTLNKLVAGTPFAAMSLTQLVLATAGRPDHAAIFNNAAQAWNHAFYWRSLRPAGGSGPSGALKSRIDASFGDLASLKEELFTVAMAQFGSGWVWLVFDGIRLDVVKTGNAGNPLATQVKPLLAIDLWEHAYYLDFQNRRPDYLHGVLEQLINWEFAGEKLAAC